MGMQKVCFYTVTEHTLENRGSKQIQLRYEWLVLGLGEFILTLASHISLRFSTSAQSFAVSTESISVYNHQHCLPSMRHKKWELQTSCSTKKMQMSPLSKALRVYCQGGAAVLSQILLPGNTSRTAFIQEELNLKLKRGWPTWLWERYSQLPVGPIAEAEQKQQAPSHLQWMADIKHFCKRV